MYTKLKIYNNKNKQIATLLQLFINSKEDRLCCFVPQPPFRTPNVHTCVHVSVSRFELEIPTVTH